MPLAPAWGNNMEQKSGGAAPGVSKTLALDVTAWMMNVSSSVLIVFVNKVLMDPTKGYGFVFATSLCSLHFFTSGAFVRMSETLGYGQHVSMPFKDTLYFSLIAGMSIASLNLSLLTNSVGFYQISKLMIIPFVCFMEAFWMKRKFTLPIIASVLVVIAGVAIVTVTDMSVNPLGLAIAAVSVVSSGMQQMLCGVVQRKHNLTSNQLLSNTAPVQGTLLLFAGPFIDKLVSRQWILDYNFTVQGAQCLGLSCAVAVLVNISQFMCLGCFSAISFQVLGHAKTVLVLLLGWLYLNDSMSMRKLGGMMMAVAGMVGYGYFTSVQQRAATSKPEPPRYTRIPGMDQEQGQQKP